MENVLMIIWTLAVAGTPGWAKLPVAVSQTQSTVPASTCESVKNEIAKQGIEAQIGDYTVDPKDGAKVRVVVLCVPIPK